jgi:hypothetical protein
MDAMICAAAARRKGWIRLETAASNRGENDLRTNGQKLSKLGHRHPFGPIVVRVVRFSDRNPLLASTG